MCQSTLASGSSSMHDRSLVTAVRKVDGELEAAAHWLYITPAHNNVSLNFAFDVG